MDRTSSFLFAIKPVGIRLLLVCCLLASFSRMSAQNTFNEMEQLTVNENVSTIITASEPVKLVDISTDSVVGDKPLDNVIRVKPKTGNHRDGEVLGIVTIITERYRCQYALIYTSRIEEAVTDKEVELVERNAFHNPEVSMSTSDMVGYAMKVWNCPAKYRGIFTRFNKMEIRLNNIYVVGEYIFIDFSVTNNTNLPFDIDQLRVKLEDKKQQKATNVQSIELKPALVLDRSQRFNKAYRNVIVLKKMTFPNDKVLSIELSEKQISGRTITLNLDYEDVLAADGFSTVMLTNFYQMDPPRQYDYRNKDYYVGASKEDYKVLKDSVETLEERIAEKKNELGRLERDSRDSRQAFDDFDAKAVVRQAELKKLNSQVEDKKQELLKLQQNYQKMEDKLAAVREALGDIGKDFGKK